MQEAKNNNSPTLFCQNFSKNELKMCSSLAEIFVSRYEGKYFPV